ncbi:hypothetical protein C8R41DRAFT_857519 [Lentinula lateritia]|uniref:Uncharacterized protein n=1 Tax=Lentinula lateritia TaxID=40482 RepID=A0ABQ8UYG2_9AGAR|nr:hypothetical protein C8R41DRAFT_857519 [Lentinula lateritia]
MKDPDFTPTRVWKEYMSCPQSVPTLPLCGLSWDITLWTEEQKKPFFFNSMSRFSWLSFHIQCLCTIQDLFAR